MTAAKKISGNHLTAVTCQVENTSVKTLGLNSSFNLAPAMARGFRCSDTRTAPKVPHNPRAVAGVFRALHGKAGML